MDPTPLKIQFGSNGRNLAGFLNTDISDDHNHCDITKPLCWLNESVQFCFAEHVMEHVTHIEALHFLDECFRILEPGGQIRLCIPVLEDLSPAHARDIITNHGHMAAYSRQLIKDFLRTAGFINVRETQRKDIDSHHKEIGVLKDDLETARIEATRP